jgi:hypothetical protein
MKAKITISVIAFTLLMVLYAEIYTEHRKTQEAKLGDKEANFGNKIVEDIERIINLIETAEPANMTITLDRKNFEQAIKTAKCNNQQLYDWNNIRQTIYQFVEHDHITPEQANHLIKGLNKETITWNPTIHRFTPSKQQKNKEKWLADNKN